MTQLTRRSLASRSLALSVVLLSLPARSVTLTVFDDQLRSSFQDWSWSPNPFVTQTAVVHSGTTAIGWMPGGWSGLSFYRGGGFSVATYTALELWVRGAAVGIGDVQVAVTDSAGNVQGSEVSFLSFVPGGAIPTAWTKATVPFASLGLTSGTYVRFHLRAATGGTQPTLYVDDVALTGPTYRPSRSRSPSTPRSTGAPSAPRSSA